MTTTKAPSRAELLELCKAAGLKATGWKKERMEEELAKLAGATSPESAEPAPETSEQEPEDPEPRNVAGVSEEPARFSVSGWCQGAPVWGRAHLTCQTRVERGQLQSCGCTCHAEDWVRPPIPEHAELSKFNREDRLARGEEAPDAPDPDGRLRELAAQAAGLKDVV